MPDDGARHIDTKTEPAAKKKSRRLMLLSLGPIAAAGVIGFIWLKGGRYAETDNAYVKAPVVELGMEIGGTVAAVEVSENEHVEAGQVLVRLDTALLEADLAGAEAALQSAKDEVAARQAGYAEAEAELAAAEEKLGFTTRDLERISQLARTRNASEARLDEARHAHDAAERERDVAAQTLERQKAGLGGDPAQAVEQYPTVRAAAARRDRAALDLEHAVLTAPLAGTVSNLPKPGHYVNVMMGAPVLSLVADSPLHVDANFKETELTHIRPGQEVEIEVDTYPGAVWHGHVESIAAATGAEFSVLPAQNASGNWVKVVQRIPVRIALDDGPDDLPLRSGMSADVSVDTGHVRHLPFLSP
jgi:membrane fusion protein (multidrug efflux system)